MNKYYTTENRTKYQHGLHFVLLLFLPALLRASDSSSCRELPMKHKCSCYNSNEGVSVDCQYVSAADIKHAVSGLADVYSLTIAELNLNDEYPGASFTPEGVCVKHIRISQTNLQALTKNSFANTGHCLQSLTIITGAINILSRNSFSTLKKLTSLEITANPIKKLPSLIFSGLPLLKLNLKGNVINDISETAFINLEATLIEVDLSENNLTTFPKSLIVLKKLKSLKLSWNGLSLLPAAVESDIISLEYLDLSSNNFEFVSEDCLRFCPSLKVLSFHFNFISNINVRAFCTLTKLETIDLSYNRIKFISPNVFQFNQNLNFIDLSHNHLHNIHELFSNLPALNEIHLSENNILEVPNESFVNSTNIRSIYLDRNSISHLHSECFYHLIKLEELFLESNFLHKVPHSIFRSNVLLSHLRLDHNKLEVLDNKTFDSLGNVKKIRLNNNNFKRIYKDLFRHVLSVEEVHLEHNNILFIEEGTFSSHENIKHLNLRHNLLPEFGYIMPRNFSRLVELHLDNNALSRLELTGDHMHLSHITLNNNKIKYLSSSSFKNLSALIRIKINNNDIATIDDYTFQHLNATRYLDLSYNSITNISNYTLFGLKELEDLNISHNNLIFVMGFAFDSLKKLRNLNLSYNPLRKLFKNIFQKGLPLSSLFLDSCDIQFIDEGTYRGLDNLKLLSLKNNSLKSIDLQSIDVPGLKYLLLSNNVIDYLSYSTFLQFPLVEVLVLEHCNLEILPENLFSMNKYLVKVNLAQNNINAIPDNFVIKDNKIVELNISNNFLDHLPINALINLTKLETLDVSDNMISMLEINDLKLLPNLRYLSLRNNEIKTIVPVKNVKLKELGHIDLSNNRIKNIPKTLFESIFRLRHLNLSGNSIQNLNLAIFSVVSVPNFINIDLSKNPVITCTNINRVDNNTLTSITYELHISSTNMTHLDEISFDSFPNLQHLFLQDNKLRRLPISPFIKLINLEDLDLAFNKILIIKSSNFRGLFKLRSLCLSNNQIESIEPFTEDLSNLKLLDLSHNKIQNILNEDLLNLKELTVLYLNNNNIKYISATSTKNLQKLTHIYLQHNKLEQLSIELLNSVENYINSIVLKDNVLKCNCERNNTWVWIQDHPKLIDVNSVSCLDFPKEKCDIPVISQLAINKHKDNSVSISWFVRNRTAIKALQLLYFNNAHDIIQSLYLEPYEVSAQVSGLEINKKYIVCILALYDETSYEINELIESLDETNEEKTKTEPTPNKSHETAVKLLMQSTSSECISLNTYKRTPLIVKPKDSFDIKAILNRRMGLMVGCCLGCVVFFIMASVLLYTKVKERKKFAKEDPGWEEELNNFSKDDINPHSTTVSTDNILLGC